ncbi:ATP-binding protein [Nocardiopsis mwathae]|nr:ATP-binding protein [Nocardiopsis mwathae]
MPVYARSFPGVPEQVAEARHWVDSVLTTAVRISLVPDDTVATAVLLVSELSTNAVLHSDGVKDDGRFTVSLTLTPGALTARVIDGGASTGRPFTLDVGPDAGPDPGPDAENGRGLRLALHFADELGTLPGECGTYFRLVWEGSDGIDGRRASVDQG